MPVTASLTFVLLSAGPLESLLRVHHMLDDTVPVYIIVLVKEMFTGHMH